MAISPDCFERRFLTARQESYPSQSPIASFEMTKGEINDLTIYDGFVRNDKRGPNDLTLSDRFVRNDKRGPNDLRLSDRFV